MLRLQIDAQFSAESRDRPGGEALHEQPCSHTKPKETSCEANNEGRTVPHGNGYERPNNDGTVEDDHQRSGDGKDGIEAPGCAKPLDGTSARVNTHREKRRETDGAVGGESQSGIGAKGWQHPLLYDARLSGRRVILGVADPET
jgi:hypothetical protein